MSVLTIICCNACSSLTIATGWVCRLCLQPSKQKPTFAKRSAALFHSRALHCTGLETLYATWDATWVCHKDFLLFENFVTTGTAHILNGLGIDSDLAPWAMSVRKCLKIGVGVYNRTSSSIGSTTHANSTQQQNQQQEQQTPKRISSQSGRKPAWKLANQKG